MEVVLISGLASACILTAIEGLIRPIGKWRGLVALIGSLGGCLVLSTPLTRLPVYGLAAAFIALVLSILVDQWTSTGSNLPPRIPPR